MTQLRLALLVLPAALGCRDASAPASPEARALAEFRGAYADVAPPSATLARGAFSRLHFTNESPRIHPIHTHGMFFRLLARNGAPVDEPFFRDTVLIHPREEIDVGVVPTDAGTWMMHCHILEHAEAGMMTTIAVVEPRSERITR